MLITATAIPAVARDFQAMPATRLNIAHERTQVTVNNPRRTECLSQGAFMRNTENNGMNISRILGVAAGETSHDISESFEDFPGGGDNWLPDGWTLQSAFDKNPNKNTWHGSYATSAFKPTNGKCQAVLMGGSSDQLGSAQNEWLISPEFTPLAGTRLYADLSTVLFSIYDRNFFDESTKTFTKRRVTGTVSIKVYSDNEWTEVYNLRDLASRRSDEELFNNFRTPASFTARIPLNDYAGKNIKVAFVYSGDKGPDVALDYITVGVPNNMAVYHRPSGFFFEGIGIDYSGDQNYAALVGPAYTDAKWNAIYTRDVESFKWIFTDPDDYDKTVEFAGSSANMKYPYAIDYAPKLTAKCDGLEDLTYQFDIANKADGIVKYGGGGIDWADDGSIIEYGCGAYNWRCGLQSPVFSYDKGDYLFGPTSNSKFWDEAGISLKSIASIYEKPLTPYIFDKVWVHASDLDADADAEFTMNIYTINEEGYLSAEPYVSSTIKTSDILKYNSGDGHLYTLLFPFDLQTIETPILLELTGFMDNPKVRIFAPLTQNAPHVDGENNGCIIYTQNGQKKISSTSQILRDFYCPFIFTMNSTYAFFFADEDEFEAPVEGGDKEFAVTSYYLTDSWDIEGDIPDWITNIEPKEIKTDDGEYEMSLCVSVDALPKNIPGRAWEFYLTAPGGRQKFFIHQGDVSGLAQIGIDNSGRAEIFNLEGYKITTCVVDADGMISGIDNLAKGIYIVRFANGNVRKISR